MIIIVNNSYSFFSIHTIMINNIDSCKHSIFDFVCIQDFEKVPLIRIIYLRKKNQ